MNQSLLEELQQKLIHQEQNKYPRQQEQLERILGCSDIYRLLEDTNAIVAGGAITSIFSNKEINDIDVYFRKIEDMVNFIKACYSEVVCVDEEEDLWHEGLAQFALKYSGHTKKSVMFNNQEGTQIQLIHCDFYEDSQGIFDSFDFTINMAAYDFKLKQFVLDEDFLPDLAARRLSVNTTTSYPIISQLRIDKYKQRGYNISRKEFVKLSLAVADMVIEDWDQAAEAIGGLYGHNYDEIFDTTKEFSLEEMMDQVDKLLPSDMKGKVFNTAIDNNYLIDVILDQHDGGNRCDQYADYQKGIGFGGNPHKNTLANILMKRTVPVVPSAAPHHPRQK